MPTVALILKTIMPQKAYVRDYLSGQERRILTVPLGVIIVFEFSMEFSDKFILKIGIWLHKNEK